MKKNILIVDDLEVNLYLLESLLKGNGYDVVSALNGQEALEKAINNPPDIIICDILMPVMDGFTLCKKWKALDTLKDIPFIFYTATYTESKDEAFALSLGADKFIRKPQDPDVLVKLIKEVVKKVEQGELTSTIPPEIDNVVHLKEYNQVLINKLEDKMQQNEAINKQLTQVILRYKSLMANAPEAIFIIDEKKQIIESNRQAAELFGYNDEEFLTLTISQLHLAQDLEKVTDTVEGIRKGSYKSFQWKYVRKDGSEFWGDLSVVYIPEIGFQAMIQDITERKNTELELEKHRENLENLVQERTAQLELKNNELERMNKLFIGRELRMKELKAEIEKLKY